jgi:hypothetical protein
MILKIIYYIFTFRLNSLIIFNMFSKINIVTFCMIMVCTSLFAEEVESNDTWDILIDVGIGFCTGWVWAVCETSSTCFAYMSVFVFVMVIFALIACCQDPDTCMKVFCTMSNVHRALFGIIGYGLFMET